jgi:SpoVK/Ycf46/Vps4 family AAA+-type ATPase
MAERLGRPLYQIDLGRVVSKWMGETERNLSRIFEEMSGTEGMILIDEADALLGKRVEVKESRDQHANVTVSHLLSLLERHFGPVFATTNLRGNLDTAYIRRFSAVVDFHRPNRGLRQNLWADALRRAGLSKARAEALAMEAAHPEMSAAEIANAAVVAQALAPGGRPGGAEIARAIMLEKTKGEMTFAPEDLGPLAPHWPQGSET